MKHVIQVTNQFGDSLFVDRLISRSRGFTVRIRKFAKEFETLEHAQNAIRNFETRQQNFEQRIKATFTALPVIETQGEQS